MLRNKIGDQQARVEVLGKLLIAVGEKPFLLRYGTGKESYYMVMLRLSPEDIERLAKQTGKKTTLVSFGKMKLLPLQLEKNLSPGEIEKKFYDPAEEHWTGTIELTQYK
ncbi:MAG TPA: hypothetical protein HPP41_00215 [Deltaproteobacteria bacterium]|nr:hypothetical protein [Deltaproteobacteria bacterium]